MASRVLCLAGHVAPQGRLIQSFPAQLSWSLGRFQPEQCLCPPPPCPKGWPLTRSLRPQPASSGPLLHLWPDSDPQAPAGKGTLAVVLLLSVFLRNEQDGASSLTRVVQSPPVGSRPSQNPLAGRRRAQHCFLSSQLIPRPLDEGLRWVHFLLC